MDRTKLSADQNAVQGAGPDAGNGDAIVAEELARLLDSPMFIRSPVLSRLLQFLVDHRLQGNRTAPKAYAIATEALGRSSDFDPAVDSYPRVMVGRLRNLLDRYYAETPWLHRLRVPQGSYEIVVQHRAAPPSARTAEAPRDAGAAEAEGLPVPGGEAAAPSPAAGPLAPRRRTVWLWLGFAAAIIAAAFAGWWFARSDGHLLGEDFVAMPTIEMSKVAAGDTGPSRAMARGLDGKLRDGLRRFELVQLLSSRDPGAAARRTPADYRLDASIVRALAGGGADITLVLNRVADDRAIWSQQIRVTDEDIPEFRGAEPAIAQIAGDYGVIVRDQLQREPANYAPGFPCLAQFNRLRQMRNPVAAQRVDTCLRASLVDMPGDPVPLGALSLLRFGDWQQLRSTPKGQEAFAEGESFAQRAYSAAPNSAAGIFAMARAHFYSGDCQRGVAMGNGAVELNPYDPEIAGFMGLFKTSCGLAADGEALLTRSVMLDDSHAGVPAVTLAFLHSQRGEQPEALALLDRMPSPSNMEPQYLMVRSIVLARMGKVDQARALWRRLLEYTGQPANAPPEMVLRQFMITPAVIARASIALREAGVVGPVPPAPAGTKPAN